MKQIILRTKFEGFHCWPDAPERVSFLRNKHRHLFGVKVKIEVLHNEREKEFFIVQEDDIQYIIKNKILGENNEASSCETMAEIMLNNLQNKYKSCRISVEINEDDENGAEINNYDNFLS